MVKKNKKMIREMYNILYAYCDEDIIKKIHDEFDSIINDYEYKELVKIKKSFITKVEKSCKYELEHMIYILKRYRDNNKYSDKPKKKMLYEKYNNKIIFIEKYIKNFYGKILKIK